MVAWLTELARLTVLTKLAVLIVVLHYKVVLPSLLLHSGKVDLGDLHLSLIQLSA